MARAFPNAPRLTCTRHLKLNFARARALADKVGWPKQEREQLVNRIFDENGIIAQAADHIDVDDRLQHLAESIENVSVQQMLQHMTPLADCGECERPQKTSSTCYKPIFIALPKKPGAVECEHHRTISLMSHITKILLKVIVMRVRNTIKPEIAAEQCGFVEGKGTTHAVFTLRVLIERALEVQKDVYLCFIDYTKAFDRVRHDEIIKELTHLHIDGEDLRITKNMYWEQTAAMRVEGEDIEEPLPERNQAAAPIYRDSLTPLENQSDSEEERGEIAVENDEACHRQGHGRLEGATRIPSV
ncbi:endonuclease-reverse transcriptase [Elysia marginata]|uniref:Endonuclease-reverse transcriptase n=1 Tax=Elysia marginata TaxID=1093978 RepID=A0AAV4ICI7_9GAST|nr:endonuclease-reverse transcriptase [Elysia marginata]